jgi:hypothetical protein
MHLFYVDESGTGLKDRRSRYFVLAALGLPAEAAAALDSSVTELKRRMVSWAPPEDFEIKGRDLRRGEKLLKGISWEHRVNMMVSVAELMARLPCRVVVIQADKRDLPESVETEEHLYRLVLWRLLDEIERDLQEVGSSGMLMIDARSDLHTSVQDRRVVDAFRQWRAGRQAVRLAELPWFGFSAFYGGLQLADFVAYLCDWAHNVDRPPDSSADRSEALKRVFETLAPRVRLVRTP